MLDADQWRDCCVVDSSNTYSEISVHLYELNLSEHSMKLAM